MPPFSPVGCARCGLPFTGQLAAYAATVLPPAPVTNPYAAQAGTWRQPQGWSQPQGWGQPQASAQPMQPPGWPAAYPAGYGYPVQPQRRDRTMEALLPVNRSTLAIIAGYLGLFSIAVIPAPFALACGILALRDLRDRPDVGGRGRAIFAIVAGGFVTGWVIVANLPGLLAG